MPRSKALEGKTVMVVEDEPMIGLLFEDILTETGCAIEGPYLTLADASGAAAETNADLAILDVKLGGVESYAVAYALESRGIPFVLASGYGRSAVPKDRPGWPVCAKPFTYDSLTSALLAMVPRATA